ncbi:MAG: hypothetical protein AB1705_05885 [Verrucomicrobiota bacterium]
MRNFPVVLAGVVCIAGCAGRQAGLDVPPEGRGTPAVIRPITVIQGKVVLVNETLRYAVIDFSVGPQPRAGQILSAYRSGQKTGEVRMSREAQQGNAAADIVAGEVKVGDEVRVD